MPIIESMNTNSLPKFLSNLIFHVDMISRWSLIVFNSMNISETWQHDTTRSLQTNFECDQLILHCRKFQQIKYQILVKDNALLESVGKMEPLINEIRDDIEVLVNASLRNDFNCKIKSDSNLLSRPCLFN